MIIFHLTEPTDEEFRTSLDYKDQNSEFVYCAYRES